MGLWACLRTCLLSATCWSPQHCSNPHHPFIFCIRRSPCDAQYLRLLMYAPDAALFLLLQKYYDNLKRQLLTDNTIMLWNERCAG